MTLVFDLISATRTLELDNNRHNRKEYEEMRDRVIEALSSGVADMTKDHNTK